MFKRYGDEGDVELPQKAQPVKPKVEILAEHTVQQGETLSHLALKYYGSAVKEKWMVIYEANKDVIGDNPNRVALGTVLKIPKLPEEAILKTGNH